MFLAHECFINIKIKIINRVEKRKSNTLEKNQLNCQVSICNRVVYFDSSVSLTEFLLTCIDFFFLNIGILLLT